MQTKQRHFVLKKLFFTKFLSKTCLNILYNSTKDFLKDFCGDPNLYQPYNNLDCALLLQQQLADSIICMFGIPIYYFRTVPREDTADYTFKEFTLRDVVAVKQLKLMIQDGQMPSSNPKLTDFDFDWETDWETELSKTQFAKAFGDNAFPKSNDFLYIPMMKRMWEVNAAYDEKNEGLMWVDSINAIVESMPDKFQGLSLEDPADAVDIATRMLTNPEYGSPYNLLFSSIKNLQN